jgi:pimeloyl-ACP methyl ester carboxylesterase
MILRPVLFIHGFDGKPEHWVEDGFPQFLAAAGDFDPDMLRLFSYGYTRTEEDGVLIYNNQGDMRQIASRLTKAPSDTAEDVASAVEQLSADSVAKGGPAEVDLVCHSIGGLIARYYLARREKDEFGTQYSDKVRKLIMLGTPQHGLMSLNLAQTLVPEGSIIRRLLDIFEKLPWTVGKFSGHLHDLDDYAAKLANLAVKELQDPHTESKLDSPAVAQTRPDSEFMQYINAPGKMPRDVEYYIIYTDIYFQLELQWLGKKLLRHRQSFGDFLVPVASSSSIPNTRATVFRYETRLGERIRMGMKMDIGNKELQGLKQGLKPDTAHSNLRRNKEIQRKVLEILSA